MTDPDPITILRERYEWLAHRHAELCAELGPLEAEMAKYQGALQAMGALDPPGPPLRLLRQPADDLVMVEEALPRVRHPDVQRAIETQTPSQAIPKGTALYCSEGCRTAHPSGGFTDLMALRTHVKRSHDREPTEQEKVPR